MSQPASQREAGFTLVELMVASVILGLVAVMIVNGMRFANRAVASADDRREAVESSTTGLGLLRSTLGRALPLYRKVESRDRLLFEGGEQRLRFVTMEPDYMPGWPLVGYQYALVDLGGRQVLEVRRADLDPAAPDLTLLADAPGRALLGFGPGVRFTYYGAQRNRDPARWHEAWTSAGILPRAVRIGPPGGAPGWPDFVMPLSIDTPAACLNPDSRDTAGCGR